MRFNKISRIVAASAIALVLLIIFQVKWMLHSRDLIEEQFNQKVGMALCNAVEETSRRCQSQEVASCQPVIKDQWLNELGLDEALNSSMSFYNIDLEYQANVVDGKEAACQPSAYSCSMGPVTQDSSLLSVSFLNQDKDTYILDRMGFMGLSSVLILLFVSITFILANLALVRQKRLNELNVSFFSNMAHEYRTPLTNIKLALSLLQRRHQSLGDDKYYQVIRQESDRLREQVERVLQLAKMESGEYQLDCQPMDLQQLLHEVVDEMQMQVSEKAGQLRLDIGDQPIEIMADAFHLGNAFRNLIDNALKYCKEKPDIRISLSTAADGVTVHFEDNGIGICKSAQPFVFDKFRRINEGDLYKQKGFGLGLCYVKMVIELHQGFIKIFSELNKGSQFNLFLPQIKG
ncbi:MAG: HAMP domain-containing sensor histidine kinase [Bacteroidota bacterium]